MEAKEVIIKYVKKAVLTFIFPVLAFAAMLIITASNKSCFVNGKFIFLTADMIRQVIMSTCMTVCVALAIWLQLKNGRFDFSGGASMILTAIIAGSIGIRTGNVWTAFAAALICGVVLSVVTAGVYIIGRLPIIICTIGMTLLYESLTYLVFGGQGITTFYSSGYLAVFGRLPGIALPTLIAVATFIVFNYFTTAGRKGKILASNQNAGVNIGINEKKNILISYVFTGIIIGMAAIVYASQNGVAPQSGLSTSGIMFSYIVPVFMGMFIGQASCDVIGIIMASIGMGIMNYGLNCINLGSGGWSQIILGCFVLGFYTFQAQAWRLQLFFGRRKNRKKL